MIKVTGKMAFLGCEKKEGKNGEYYLPKFIDQGGSIFEFYVNKERHQLMSDLDSCKQFTGYTVEIEITSYQNKPQVNLIKVLTA